MRIGFDAKRIYNNITGLGNYSRQVVESMLRYYPDNKYYLYTPTINSGFKHVFANKKQVDIVKPRIIGKSLKHRWRTQKLPLRWNRDKLDVYHGLSNELPKDCHRSATKTVVTMHDLIFKRYPEFYKPWDITTYDKKAARTLQEADAIVAISEQTKRDIQEFYDVDEAKIHVIYQDCAKQFHQEQSQEKLDAVKAKYKLPDKYILCVGTIEKRKNQLGLVRAFRKIADKIDEDLVIVGKKTPYYDSVAAFIAKYGLENRVRFEHDADFADFPAIYAQANVFVYPSLFEGFGIPIIEAQNCGVPVVTSEGSCFPEAGGPHSLYVDPGHSMQIARAIQTVVSDKSKSDDMIKAGKEYVQKFRAERTTKQLMELYTQL